jgi:hypothetical protein
MPVNGLLPCHGPIKTGISRCFPLLYLLMGYCPVMALVRQGYVINSLSTTHADGILPCHDQRKAEICHHFTLYYA